MVLATLNGCYGKFALTRKIYQVNGQVSERHLRSALTWVFIIIPVYQVAALADFIAFNTIEFWSGTNPVAEGSKSFQYTDGERRFDIHADKSGETVSYRIRQFDGDRFTSSIDIKWDLTTDMATAEHRQPTGSTFYVASRVVDQVQVKTFNDGIAALRTNLAALDR